MESKVTETLENVANDPKLTNGFNLGEFLKFEIAGFKIGNIIFAIVILIIGVVIKYIIDLILKKILTKPDTNPKIGNAIKKIADVIIIFFIIMTVASALGVNTASIIALVSVMSLGIVLALNDILGNMAGGIEILTSKIFQIGDYIMVGEAEGFVEGMNLTHTTIRTLDNYVISIPNKDVSSKAVCNFHGKNLRRNPIVVTASYDSDSDLVEKALIEAATDEPAVLADPKPFVFLTNYLESSIQYTLYFWTPAKNWWEPKMHVNKRIREKFKKYGLEMTYNHLNVHFDKEFIEK